MFTSADIILKTHFSEAFVRVSNEEEKNDHISFNMITDDVNPGTIETIISYPKSSPELNGLILEAYNNRLIISPDYNL